MVRRDGREPMGLGAAIGALVAERAWELPAAGATLRQRWEAIAPELAGHVVAVGYDADSGRRTGTADYRVDLPGGYMHVSVAADGAMALTGPAVITAVSTIRLSRAGDTTI
ncbi:hypothetical protein ABT150_54475 [Streptomyces mirabilis]|uniref:hypothetical protein n=1 Tax=Streptomyces mirabilis TaxID=68239 RepID=UPI00331C2C71